MIRRLEFDELEPQLAELLRPRVKRLGYLGEFFKCMAHQPAALRHFTELTEDLKHALPDKLTELVALTVAGTMRNSYERHQHERLSETLGFGRAWIADVNLLSPGAAVSLSSDERAVQSLVLAVVQRGGCDCAAERDAAERAVGAEVLAGVLMLIGRYMMHSIIVNTLELAPPVTSIFAEKVS